jgi:putative sterol carrier protein
MAETVREFFDGLQEKINLEAIKDMNATYQFAITGDDAGTWHVKLADGSAAVVEGETSDADITIRTDSATWLGILDGSVSGEMAFVSGTLQVEGDVGLALQMQDVIGQ